MASPSLVAPQGQHQHPAGSAQQQPTAAARLVSGQQCRQDRRVQTVAPELQHRFSSPSSDSTPKTLGANAGRDAFELSSCDTTPTPHWAMAVPYPHLCCSSLARRPKQDEKRIPHICVSTAPFPASRVLKTTNNLTRHGTARHVTSRHDSTQTFSPYHPADRLVSRFFFCRLPFPPPPPHPPVVPESAGANHHRLLPTKKSAVATFFFSLEENLSISVLPTH